MMLNSYKLVQLVLAVAFYRAKSYASAVLGMVILYVCLSVFLSVCHTRAL